MSGSNIHFEGKKLIALPALINAARNGVSTETVAGVVYVVLGNAVGAVGDPGQLLSDREIMMNAFNILLNGGPTGSVRFNATNIVVTSGNLINYRAIYVTTGVVADFAAQEFGASFFVQSTQRGIHIFSNASPQVGNVRIGNLPTAFSDNNTATLQVAGTLTNDFFVSPQTATPYAINANNDKNKVFTNEGAAVQIQFNLPTAAAGRMFEFIVQDADGIIIDAAAGDTIRIAGDVTAASGSISSTTVGSTIKLKAINATEWIATSMTGAWTI